MTDEDSRRCYEEFFNETGEINLKYRLLTYNDIIKSNQEIPDLLSHSLLIFDDLTDKNQRRINVCLEQIINVLNHHMMLCTILNVHNVIKCSLTPLLLKVNEIQLAVSNQSSIKTLKYLASYYFSKYEKESLLKSYEIAKKYNKEDSYLVINMKKYSTNVSVLINRFGYLNHSRRRKACLTILNTGDVSEDESWVWSKENNTYMRDPLNESRVITFSNWEKYGSALKKGMSFESVPPTGFAETSDDGEFVLFPKKDYDSLFRILSNEFDGDIDDGIEEKDDDF